MEARKIIHQRDFVAELIPQKVPFAMVDKMYSYTETSVVAGLKVCPDNIFLSNMLLLEAGVIEHMAQSVALHTGYQFFLKKEKAPTGYIGSIKEIVIKQLPNLGDELVTTVDIIHEFAGITLVNICTILNGNNIAEGQMKTVLAK